MNSSEVDEHFNNIYNSIEIRFQSIENELDNIVNNIKFENVVVKLNNSNVGFHNCGMLGDFRIFSKFKCLKYCVIPAYDKSVKPVISGFNNFKPFISSLPPKIKSDRYFNWVMVRNGIFYTFTESFFRKTFYKHVTEFKETYYRNIFRTYIPNVEEPVVFFLDSFVGSKFTLDDTNIYFYDKRGLHYICDLVGNKSSITPPSVPANRYHSFDNRNTDILNVFLSDLFLIINTFTYFFFYSKKTCLISHELENCFTSPAFFAEFFFTDNYFIQLNHNPLFCEEAHYKILFFNGKIDKVYIKGLELKHLGHKICHIARDCIWFDSGEFGDTLKKIKMKL